MRQNVLFLPHPMPELAGDWQSRRLAALAHHDLRSYDESQSMDPQFEGVSGVVDHGGSAATRPLMDAGARARVKLWQILGTGFDHFDLAYIKSLGVPVSNCPGQFSSVALAQSAMMFILMLAHRFQEARSGFDRGELYRFTGRDLDGLVLGIIGFGASGQDLARRARGFGMKIHAIDVVDIAPEVLEELAPDFMGTPEDLDKVVAESDFISLHLHLNEETRHTIDRRLMELMKPTACLINVARGALIDEDTLAEFILEGRIGGAGIDVFEQEPPDVTRPEYKQDNMVVMPHTAGSTDGTARKRAACAARNVDLIAAGKAPLCRIAL